MKKKFLMSALCLFLLASCNGGGSSEVSAPSSAPAPSSSSEVVVSSSEETSSESQITTAAYKVVYYLEDATGEFNLDDSKTETLSGNIGETITVTPKTVDGYVCISTEDELSTTIVAAGTATVELMYRKAYTVAVKEKAVAVWAEGEVVTPVGDTITLTRTGEDPVDFVLSEEMLVSADPGDGDSLHVVFNRNDLSYEFDYSYLIIPTDLREDVMTEVAPYLKGVRYQANMGIYDWNQTYQIDIYKDGDSDHNFSEYDLTQDPTFNGLFEEFLVDVATLKEDESAVVTRITEFKAQAVAAYETFMLDQILDCLRDFFSTLNFGVFAGNTGKVKCGEVQQDPANDCWVYVDPFAELQNGDTTHDSRWWIPSCYKSDTFIPYVNSLKGTLKSYDAINEMGVKLMIQAVKISYLAIAEALTYHALATNSHLTVSGDTNASVWWFLWTYYTGSSPFTYDGPMSVDIGSVQEWRLCGAIFDTANSVYAGGTLDGTFANCNWVIAHQIDDMFAGI